MHIAYSKTIKGAGIFAGGPYLCALGNTEAAVTTCMTTPALINVALLEETVVGLEVASQIDSTSNLAGSKVFIYSGKSDSVVHTGVVIANAKMYAGYKAEVQTEYDINSGHCIPTLSYGIACASTGTPYLNKCEWYGVEHMLNWIVGPLNPPTDAIPDNIHEFD
jgi:hypothetical protein